MTENVIKQPARGFHFQPFKPQYRHFIMKDLPDSPVALFQLFCPESLIEKWVIWTNDWVAFQLQSRESTLANRARLRDWTPISLAEVHIWLACLIYIGIQTKKTRSRPLEDLPSRGNASNRPDHRVHEL